MAGGDPRSGGDESGRSTPAFEGQRSPFERGNETATTHGAHSDRRVVPLAEKHYRELRRAIEEEFGWSAIYEIPARRLSRGEAIAELLTAWIDTHSVVDDAGEVVAAVRELIRSDRRALDYSRELALTIRARAQLDLDAARTKAALDPAEVRTVIVLAFTAAAQFVPPGQREAFTAALDAQLSALPAGDSLELPDGPPAASDPRPLADEPGGA